MTEIDAAAAAAAAAAAPVVVVVVVVVVLIVPPQRHSPDVLSGANDHLLADQVLDFLLLISDICRWQNRRHVSYTQVHVGSAVVYQTALVDLNFSTSDQ